MGIKPPPTGGGRGGYWNERSPVSTAAVGSYLVSSPPRPHNHFWLFLYNST